MCKCICVASLQPSPGNRPAHRGPGTPGDTVWQKEGPRRTHSDKRGVRSWAHEQRRGSVLIRAPMSTGTNVFQRLEVKVSRQANVWKGLPVMGRCRGWGWGTEGREGGLRGERRQREGGPSKDSVPGPRSVLTVPHRGHRHRDPGRLPASSPALGQAPSQDQTAFIWGNTGHGI